MQNLMTRTSNTIQFNELSRKTFLDRFKMSWQVGQHVTLVGTTGDGKTYLAKDLCDMRKYCVVVATKKADDSLERFIKDKWHVVKKWPPDFHQEHVLYWSRPKDLGDFNDQRKKIYDALAGIYYSGGWTCYMDDIFYIANTLHLNEVIKMLYTQVRSQDVSLLGSIQRPAWVPVEVLSQSSHMLIFGLHNDNDTETSAKEQGIKPAILKEAVKQLEKYEFVWCRRGKQPIIIRNDKKE